MLAPRFEPQLTPAFVARALGLSLPPALLSGTKHDFSSITTDSRKAQAGCLFVCLKGENFDAHHFIPEVLKKGAKGIVCRRGTLVQDPSGAQIFHVDDTLEAFRKLAATWRREFSLPVAVVAGSVGKTTTKELLTAILGGKFSSVLKTQGSQNGFVGIPMTLLELRGQHQAAVIEVGIDEIGAMKQHMELVGANASVLTTIGPEHLEKLRDIPTVAQEEGLALTSVAQTGGLVAINLDDQWIKPHAKTIRGGTKITYSLVQKEARLYGQYSSSENKLEVHDTSLRASATYTLPLPGAHNALNALAAIALATGLGLTPIDIQAGLKTFRSAGGRSETREIGSNPFVCDYYNANPTSTEAGIELLVQIARESRAPSRFACLGDMLELGSGEERFHRELAQPLGRHKIEHVFLYGPRMKWLQDELQTRGFQGEIRHFEQHSELAKELVASLKPGDAVLLKGSRGMKMEEVLKALESCLPKS